MPIARSHDQRVDEAVETLDRYIIDPFWSEFLGAQTPRIPGAPRPILLDLVSSLLHGTYAGTTPYRIELTELERYLEQLQLHGRQHVFLFTLEPSRLDPLRDPAQVKKLLGEDARLYNAHEDVARNRRARTGAQYLIPNQFLATHCDSLHWDKIARHLARTQSIG